MGFVFQFLILLPIVAPIYAFAIGSALVGIPVSLLSLATIIFLIKRPKLGRTLWGILFVIGLVLGLILLFG